MKRLLLLLSLCLGTSLMSTVLISCSEDSPVEPEDPNKGRRSFISAFYAQYDQTLPVFASVDDSVTISNLSYGNMGSGLAPIGNKKIKLETQTRHELATSNEVQIDSQHSVWVLYGGSGTSNEAIAVSTAKTYGFPATTHAAVRFINASKNAAKVQVRLDLANGTTLTQNFIEYGKSSAGFTPIAITSTALVMVDESGNVVYTLPLSGLQGGKFYTAIMYGSADAGATTNRLTAKTFLEPGQ